MAPRAPTKALAHLLGNGKDRAEQMTELAASATQLPTKRTVTEAALINHFLTTVPALSGAGAVTLSTLAHTVPGLACRTGHTMYRTNDHPDTFYIVVDGEVTLIDVRDKEDPEMDDPVVVRLRCGDSFGGEEMLAEARRPYTATACVDSLVLAVPWEQFVRLVEPVMRGTFEAKLDFLSALAPFRPLPATIMRRLAPAFLNIEYKPKDVMVRQGDRADSLYCIYRGDVSVVIDPNYQAGELVATPSGGKPVNEPNLKKSKQVCTIGLGAIIGDMTVLGNIKRRTASIICMADVSAYKIRRAAFLSRVPKEQREALRRLAQDKLKMTEHRVKAGNGIDHKSQILHGHNLRELLMQQIRTHGHGSGLLGEDTPKSNKPMLSPRAIAVNKKEEERLSRQEGGEYQQLIYMLRKYRKPGTLELPERYSAVPKLLVNTPQQHRPQPKSSAPDTAGSASAPASPLFIPSRPTSPGPMRASTSGGGRMSHGGQRAGSGSGTPPVSPGRHQRQAQQRRSSDERRHVLRSHTIRPPPNHTDIGAWLLGRSLPSAELLAASGDFPGGVRAPGAAPPSPQPLFSASMEGTAPPPTGPRVMAIPYVLQPNQQQQHEHQQQQQSRAKNNDIVDARHRPWRPATPPDASATSAPDSDIMSARQTLALLMASLTEPSTPSSPLKLMSPRSASMPHWPGGAAGGDAPEGSLSREASGIAASKEGRAAAGSGSHTAGGVAAAAAAGAGGVTSGGAAGAAPGAGGGISISISPVPPGAQTPTGPMYVGPAGQLMSPRATMSHGTALRMVPQPHFLSPSAIAAVAAVEDSLSPSQRLQSPAAGTGRAGGASPARVPSPSRGGLNHEDALRHGRGCGGPLASGRRTAASGATSSLAAEGYHSAGSGGALTPSSLPATVPFHLAVHDNARTGLLSRSGHGFAARDEVVMCVSPIRHEGITKALVQLDFHSALGPENAHVQSIQDLMDVAGVRDRQPGTKLMEVQSRRGGMHYRPMVSKSSFM